eukprot:CAMPEP_0184648838 /NCGR_PEP_ID=MMETSP0308-20130426/6079_1 /TAXON_ID=38269 /ORGANISM="Gloeochaete witrockiana, Strain SAG 46.84" /LENGTH=156 /DNA_ID=CAMNT_0027081071 /DNA_START=56 /DNA_END=526 /DNA_ORIENTATION=-
MENAMDYVLGEEVTPNMNTEPEEGTSLTMRGSQLPMSEQERKLSLLLEKFRDSLREKEEALEALQQQSDGLLFDIDHHEEDNTSEEKLDEMKAHLAELMEDISMKETKINEMKEKLAEIESVMEPTGSDDTSEEDEEAGSQREIELHDISLGIRDL